MSVFQSLGIAGMQAPLLGVIVLAGCAIAVFGLSTGYRDSQRVADRIAASRRKDAGPQQGAAPSQAPVMVDPVGAEIQPEDAERYEVARALARAGFRGPRAVAAYYGVRVALAVGLPTVFAGLVMLAQSPLASEGLATRLGGVAPTSVVQGVALLVGIGFFAPTWWLRSRIAQRKRSIEEALPNMLDLLQVGIEAGMGFDQAFEQVATEIQAAEPELAAEMFLLQQEIRAGRDREAALLAMARRTGVDAVSSFVNVVIQTARFGTPMTDALTVYAEEIRHARELRAQEKAQKLPVLMSGVMATLMLPALCGLVLAPVVIRYLDAFN